MAECYKESPVKDDAWASATKQMLSQSASEVTSLEDRRFSKYCGKPEI